MATRQASLQNSSYCIYPQLPVVKALITGSYCSTLPIHSYPYQKYVYFTKTATPLDLWASLPQRGLFIETVILALFSLFLPPCKQRSAELAGTVCRTLECNRRWSSMKRKMIEDECSIVNTDTKQDVHKPLFPLVQINSQVTGTTQWPIGYSAKGHTVQTEGSL